MTGKLEVQVEGGDLLHSKINGDGYVDTDVKLQKIFAGVEAALNKQEPEMGRQMIRSMVVQLQNMMEIPETIKKMAGNS